jgi:HK97 gp10 family phage protein
MGLRLDGAREWSATLSELPAELQRSALYVALHRSATVIQQAVRNAAPLGTEPSRKTRRVRTAFVARGRQRVKLRLVAPVTVSYDYGRLQQNIRRRRLRANSGEIGVEVTRGRAFWAFFLEKGTRRMRPHPFWQAAARNAEAAARAEFEKQFRRAVQIALSRTYRVPTPPSTPAS